MRLFSFLTHPAFVLASVGMILISGDNNGGIYAQFFLLNLLHLELFSVVGAIGLALLLIAFISEHQHPDRSYRPMHSVGILLIQSSVVLLLYKLPWENSYQTYQGLPLIVLMLASITTTAYLFKFLFLRTRP